MVNLLLHGVVQSKPTYAPIFNPQYHILEKPLCISSIWAIHFLLPPGRKSRMLTDGGKRQSQLGTSHL